MSCLCLCDTSGSIAARTTRRQRPHIQTARIDRHLLDYKYEVLLRHDGLRLCVSGHGRYCTAWGYHTYVQKPAGIVLHLLSVSFLAASGINYSAQSGLLFAISDFLSFSLPKQALLPPHKRRRLLNRLSSPLLSSLGTFVFVGPVRCSLG